MTNRDAPITDQQDRFALATAFGLGPTIAARVVGYRHPSVIGARLIQDERIRNVVRARRHRRLDKLASLSLRELEAVIRDRSISQAVRFNAIKLSLALAGHVEAKSVPDEGDPLKGKSIAAMSVAELDEVIRREKARRAEAARPFIDQATA
jgi:phage terminase small subunit